LNIRRGTKKLSILVTAGPTRERIDPIRFISNYSTGTFGYEIAKEAGRRGHAVTLISGPTALEIPKGVKSVRVESALDMKRAVERAFAKADCIIMAAAVSDWRVRDVVSAKMKRRSGRKRLELAENPDILAELGKKKGGKVLVGFALETEDLEKNALKKLREKNLDLIVANRLNRKSTVFGDRFLDILMLDRFLNKKTLSRKSKKEAAKIILDKVEEFTL
jgi:phosphopantothenoylcysteine decarboxylase/phosphopantothenate--cysteine ligase